MPEIPDTPLNYIICGMLFLIAYYLWRAFSVPDEEFKKTTRGPKGF